MEALRELLIPSWDAEHWIQEGWNEITAEEKKQVKARLDEMFKEGLPFEVKKDKLLYIHVFSLLAQLEVLAIQVPLKFESSIADPLLKKLMRQQLLDEIFHGLVFTKILYLLCAPYALPPPYSENIEILCNFIRKENDPKVAVVLLNLISESWIEEFFYCLKRSGIAPKVFDTIIDDEHRHVDQAELYKNIGFPDQSLIAGKIEFMEKQLVTNIFLQYKYSVSASILIGYEGIINFIKSLNTKHHKQLSTLKLKPSSSWEHTIKFASQFFTQFVSYGETVDEMELTPLRKLLNSQWKPPSDPTMVGHFNLNITSFDYFSGQYPPETLLLLILQSLSLSAFENQAWRLFMDRDKMYKVNDSYLGLILKLPRCNHHLGTIVFKNCHNLPLQTLVARIKNIRKKMVYCFKKCEQLEQDYPYLLKQTEIPLLEVADTYYSCQPPGNPLMSLTDLSSFGFSQAKSPLRPNETAKFTMLEVERKPVWNHKTQQFEPQDLLALSVSADHRVVDGSVRIQKTISDSFDRVLANMKQGLFAVPKNNPVNNDNVFKNAIELLLENNLELGYKFLSILRFVWSEDLLPLDQILSSKYLKKDFLKMANSLVQSSLSS